MRAAATRLTRLLKLSFGGVCCICRSGDAGGSGVAGGTVTGFLARREVMVDVRVGEICSYSAESRFSSEYTVRVETAVGGVRSRRPAAAGKSGSSGEVGCLTGLEWGAERSRGRTRNWASHDES